MCVHLRLARILFDAWAPTSHVCRDLIDTLIVPNSSASATSLTSEIPVVGMGELYANEHKYG